MEKKEVFRLIRGSIKSDKFEFSLTFGIIFEVNGVYSVEAYFNDEELLDEFRKNHINEIFNGSFITEDLSELEVYKLDTISVNPKSQKITLVCLSEMILRTNSFGVSRLNISDAEVVYLELEGLKMVFSDFTSRQDARPQTGQVYKSYLPDHTSAQLIVDHNPFAHVYRKSKTSENIVVEFHSETVSNILDYKRYLTFKEDYIALVSLFNGAEVRVRKEFIGSRITGPAIDVKSEIVIYYSFSTIRNVSYNKYIPLGYAIQNRNPNMLGEALLLNFDNFREWNRKVSLSTVIYYLNGAEVARSMEEKFFIQIIAFERLTTLYAKQSGLTDEHLPSSNDFDPIKKQFFDLLFSHKKSFGANYEKARSVLGNLNEVKRISTKDKMYGIIQDVQITIDDDVRELIDKIRNKVVHWGEIGEGSKGIIHLCLINELLQEIILRLIKYKGPRCSEALLTKKLQSHLLDK